MYKRGLAFLLAAVLAFAPVMQVNAQMPVSAATMMTEGGAEESETPVAESPAEADSAAPEVTPDVPAEEVETPSSVPAEIPSATPEDDSEPSETAEVPEESVAPAVSEAPETPEESATPAATENPEETPSSNPEESVSPEVSENPEPEESPEVSENPEVSESPEASETPETSPETDGEAETDAEVGEDADAETDADTETDDETEIEEDIDVNSEIDLEKVIIGSIDLSEQTTDTSGEGWTWTASSKTFTMNGYHASRSKLTLPAGATVMLAKGSENSIDNCTNSEYGVYGIYGNGDLTITGSGKLTMLYKGWKAIECDPSGVVTFSETNLHFIHPEGSMKKPFPYRSLGVRIFASNITVETDSWDDLKKSQVTIEGSTITTGTDTYDKYFAVLNEETGLYEWILKRDAVYFTKQPKEITELTVGQSATLSVAVKNNSGSSAKYQWYKTENYGTPTSGAVKVTGATGTKLTVTPKKSGIEYYYCQITAGKNKAISDCVAVVTGRKGAKVCTSRISEFEYGTESVDKLAEDGYKWDKATRTLTIKDMDLLVPFGKIDDIELHGGDTLVVEGTNYLNGAKGKIAIYDSDEGETDVIITGTGSITLDRIKLISTSNSGQFTLCGGIKLYMNTFGDYYADIVMDNAICYSGETEAMKNGGLTLKNGSYLEVDSAFQVNQGIHLEGGSKMLCGKYLLCYNNMFIGEDCKLIIEEYLKVPVNTINPNMQLAVNGTLQVKAQKTAYIPIQLYSHAENSLMLGEGVRVISPEGAEWTYIPDSNSFYGFKYQNSFLMNGLTIGKEAVTSKKITGSKEITGTPKYGNTLKIGTIDQKNAAVSYRWQYAKTPTGTWTDIQGAKSPTYQVETIWHGYYLRAVIRGLGEYKGEIISDPVGPVVGNPTALYGIWGTDGSEKGFVVGTTPFDGADTHYRSGDGVTSGMTAEGTVTYHAMPVNSKATVTIRNNTTGFIAKAGKVVEVPVQPGENEIIIEVKNGIDIMRYYVYHEIEDIYYTLELDTDYAPNYPGPVTASWVEDGEAKSVTLEEEDGYRHKFSIKAGTEVTITSEPAAGTYTYRYIGLGAKPAKNEPGYPATFIMKEDTCVVFDYSCVKAYSPEGLSANWLLREDAAEIKVKAVPVPGTNPVKYMEYALCVYDEEGTNVRTTYLGGNRNTTVTEGYFVYTETYLNSQKSYRIEVIHNEYLGDIVEGTQATYTLKPRKPVSLSAEKEYVVLKPNTTGKVKIKYEGREGGELKVLDNYDTAVVDATGTKIVTAQDGTKELQISAKGEGTTYLTIRGEDYQCFNNDDVGYVFTTLRVDVSSVEDAESLKLGTKTGTLNLYDDSALTIPVYQMDCGYPITGAVFSDAAVNEKFAITVVDDRTLKVVPKVPADDGVIDYSKWLAQSGRTGTFSSKVTVNYKGAASKESSEKLKITLTAKKPKVSVSALSFNSFYTDQMKNLKVTVKGEKVAKVQVDTAKNTGNKVAIPAYLSLKEVDRSVRFNGNAVPANSVNTSIYLKVWPEGYRIPLQTKATVKVSYQKPKLKLKDSTITMMKLMKVDLTLLSADKNVKYADLNVQSVRMMNESELVRLSMKERRSYLALDYFQVEEFDATTGVVTLDYDGTATQENGKVALFVNISKGKEPIKVTFNLKFVKPTLTAAKKEITMDSICGGYGAYYDEQYVKLKTNIDNYEITSYNLTTKILKDGDKTGTDYSPYFTVLWDFSKKALNIMHKQPCKEGTYKLYAYLQGVEKPAVITIKMIRSKTPALNATGKEFTINKMKDARLTKKQVTIFVPEKFANGYKEYSIDIVKPDGTTDNRYINVKNEGWDNQKNGYKYTISAADDTPNGTYKVTFRGYLYGATNNDNVVFLKPVTVKVKVTDAVPAMKLKNQTVSINKDLQGYDAACAELPFDEDYRYKEGYYGGEFEWSVVSITDTKGRDAEEKISYMLDLLTSCGYLNVWANEKTEYGATYKVKLALCYANGVEKYTTVNVKVAKKNAAISAKAKALGSIDLARNESGEVEIIYSFTNKDGWGYGSYSNGIDYEWEVYAKNGKKAVTTANGALDNKGLVAKGSFAGGETEGSWFKNTDYYGGVALCADKTSDAWKNNQIAGHYTYTVKGKLVLENIDKSVKLPDVKLKVKNGTAKYALDKNTITLAKADEKGRAFITINNKNNDYLEMMDIAYVEMVSDKKIPVSKAIEIVPAYQTDKSITYEVRWKDLKSSNVKNGTVKLRVYLEGNNPKWKKPNTTLSLKVNIK